jgi:tetratricopeptide (TPR) repeat protein
MCECGYSRSSLDEDDHTWLSGQLQEAICEGNTFSDSASCPTNNCNHLLALQIYDLFGQADEKEHATMLRARISLWKIFAMKSSTAFALGCLITLFLKASVVAQQREGHEHSYAIPEEGTGLAHMDISCSPAVVAKFDRALALLHNFWYSRALEGFQQILSADPQCAMAYWGAAMTYNHPFWDAPSASDETAAWHFVQNALAAKEMSSRERLYVHAVAALFKDGGAGPKGARDEGYRDAMAIAYSRFPDDETKLFYGLAILGTIAEGTKGFERQDQAAKLFEEVYASNPSHPGALHYLIHVYDDPEHAKQGLKAARSYAKSAAAVPHALHMPSHIFTRLGYWDESAATNERAWQASESDVKRAGEPGTLRDFHSLNYLQYAYLQLGRYRDARRALDIIAAQYDALSDKTTAPDTPELQSRHVRGRTIYAMPDRIVYGYFDMLTRYAVETKIGMLPLIFRCLCHRGILSR